MPEKLSFVYAFTEAKARCPRRVIFLANFLNDNAATKNNGRDIRRMNVSTTFTVNITIIKRTKTITEEITSIDIPTVSPKSLESVLILETIFPKGFLSKKDKS
jgi:hypothetical protein